MSTTIRQTQGGIYSRKMLFRFVRVRLSRKLWATYKFRNRDIISRPLALLLGMLIGPAFALPAGEVVVGGSATVNRASADSMTVNQGTARAAINWQSFNIGTGQSVTFVQPNANSVILNRVVGNDSSAIYGSLKANGQVFLLNSNGVYFSPTASVNTGALVASSLAMSTADFMSGRMLFTAPQGMTPGSVVNKGTIISAANGYVMLAAPRVINEGLISAPGGSVGLVAGSRVLMDREGDGVMRFSVDAAVVGAIVSNSGVISADGGRVMLAASSLDGALATVVNQTGHIKANSIGKQGGVITLRAVGGDTIVDGGRIEANGTGVGSTGGTVQVLGDRVGLINGASFSATGTNGGGTVLIGGDFQGKNPEVQNASRTFVGKGVTINADATGNGDGGKVVVWADDITRYYGAISVRGGAAGGNGGNVEVSGKGDLVYRGTVDATAANGKVGTLLLDPTNIVVAAADPADGSFTADLTTVDQFADADIGAGVSTIDVASIDGAAANVTLQATNDITFNTPVNIAGAGIGLTAQAGNNIAWGANAITTNGGAISFTANDAGGTPTGTGGISGTGMLTSGGGAVTLNVPSGTGTIAVGDISSAGGLITISSVSAFSQTGIITSGGGNIDLKSDGSLGIGNNIVAGAGNVYLTSGAGISQTGGSITAVNLGMTAAGAIAVNNAANNVTNVAASTSTGNIQYQDADAVTIINVASSGNYVANAATTGITTGAGNGNVDVKSGGLMTITNDILAGTGNVYLTSAAGITETSGAAKIIATNLGMTAAGAIAVNNAANNVTNVAASTSTGNIQYQDADAVTIINVASSGNYVANAATTGITTGAGNGNVDVKSGGLMTITNDILAGTGNVYLTSAAGITETSGGTKIIATNLGMTAAGTIAVNNAANNVTNVAASTSTGNIQYQDADAVTIINVASSGNYVANAATTGITTGAGNGNVDVKSGGLMTITNDILAGTGNVYLTSAAGITETSGGTKIIATNLGMTAAGTIAVNNAANNVTNVAASTSTGNIQYQDADAVTIINVASSGNYVANAATTGITTGAGNGNVDVKSGGLMTITNDILAGTGNVYLTSAAGITETSGGTKIIATNLGMTAAGAIAVNNAANNVTNVAASTSTGNIQYQDADAVTIINVASSGNYVANAATTGITTGAGNGNVDVKSGGLMTITNDILAGTGNVYLTSAAGITETSGGTKIIATNLGMTAAGAIAVNNAANNVTNVAASTSTGNIQYQDADAVTIINVASSGNYVANAATTGITTGAGNGNVDVKSGGLMTITNDILAGTGNVYLTSAAGITETSGGTKIIATNLGMTAAGAIAVNNAANNVTNVAASTSTGNIQYQDADAVTIINVASSGNYVANAATTGITTGAGNGNVDVKSGGLMTITNDILAGTGNVYLTSAAGITETSGGTKIIATNLGMTAAGAIAVNNAANNVTNVAASTSTGNIQYQDADAVTIINVASSGNYVANAATTGITTGAGNGNVDVKSGGLMTITNDILAGTGNVYLTSAAGITETSGAAKIIATNLGMTAAGAIAVNNAANNVTNVAASTSTGNIQYQDADAVTIINVASSGNYVANAATTGITTGAGNGNVDVKSGGLMTITNDILAGTGNVYLTSAAGITETSGGTKIIATNLGMTAAGTIAVNNAANNVTNVAASTSTGNIQYQDADAVTIINVASSGNYVANAATTGITTGAGNGNVDVKSGGLMTITNDILAGTGNVYLTSAAGITETSGGTKIIATNLGMTAAGTIAVNNAANNVTNVAASTSTGNIQYQDADAVTIINVASSGNYVANAATTGITTGAGNGNVDVKSGGLMTITNDILAGTGNVYLTSAAGITETSGGTKIIATNLGMTAAGAIAVNNAANNVTNVAASTSTGNIQYQDADAVTIINVASSGNYVANAATTGITTGAGNGNVDVKSGGLMTITNDILAGTGNVYLTSAAGITETSGGTKIIATNLGMTAAGAIAVNNAANNVTNVAASTSTGNIQYQDADAVTIINVASSGNYVANAATTGITTGAGNGNVDVKSGGLMTITNDILAGTGNVYLTSAAGITETSGGTKIIATNLGMTAAGAIAVNNAANNVTNVAASTSTGNIQYQDADAVTIINVASSGNYVANAATTGITTGAGNGNVDVKSGGLMTITNDILAGTGNVYLTSAAGITETSGAAKIIATNLGMTAAGAIAVNNAANNVTNVAASTSTGNIQYQDADAVTIINVASSGNYVANAATTGITTGAGNGNVDVKSGGLMTITNDILAGTGNVYLTSAAGITETSGGTKIIATNLGMTAAGAIAVNNAANNVTNVAASTSTGNIQYQDADAVTIINVASSGNYVANAATTGITTGAGNGNVDVKSGGLMTITNDILAGTGNVYLTSAAGITETSGGTKIIATNLGMTAAGAIAVNNAANNVTNVAASTSTGNIQYQDADAVTIINVASSGNYVANAATTGITTGAGNGNVDVKSGGLMTITNDILAGTANSGGTVYLTSGGTITEGGSAKIYGSTLAMSAGGAITATNAANAVGALAAATTSGGITYQDSDALTLANVATSASGNYVANAGTTAITTAAGNGAIAITTNTAAGAIMIAGGVVAGSGNVTITTSDASITETGNGLISTTGLTTIAAGTGGVTLASASNDFNKLAVTSGALVIRDVNDLEVTFLSVQPNSGINIQADRTLTLVAGNINTGTADLRLSSGGALAALPGTLTGANITLQAAGLTLDKDVTTPGMLTIVSPTVNQTGGKLAVTGATDIVATTSVVLNRPLNDFVGTVSITSPSVMITDANKLTLNLRGTGDQTVSTTTAGDMTLTSQAARLTVDFTGVTGKAVLNFPLANYLNMLSVINPTFNGTSLEFNYGVSQLRAGSVAAAGSTSGFLVIGDKSTTVSESNRGVVSARLKFLGNATLLCVNGLDCAPPNEAERVSPAITAVLQQAERDAQADAAGLGRIARKLKTNSIDIADLVAPLAIPSVVRRAPCAAEQEAGEASNGTCK